MTSSPSLARKGRGGFTLVEALVAFTILTLAVVGMIWSRSKAVQQATEARNLKLAVKIARETLDKLKAGMNQENPVDLNNWQEVENYPGYYVRIITGDMEISDFETVLAEEEDDQKQLERLDLQERLRLARETRAGAESMSAGGASAGNAGTGMDNPDGTGEEVPIDENTTQEILVAVKYPSLNFKKHPNGEGIFLLRDQISTLALSGRTPEEVEEGKSTLEGLSGSQAGGDAGGGR